MPQASQVKNHFTFVGGLISEASPLTFPEDASLDELNFELLLNGSRRKRLGIDYEANYAYSSDISTNVFSTGVVSTYIWKSVGENGNLTFAVIQIGSMLYFHDVSDSQTSISSGLQSFTVDLTSYKAPNAISAATERVAMASGKGFLFVNSKAIEPLYIKYNPVEGSTPASITVVEYPIYIRDFEGVDDGLGVSERPSTLSEEHKYNIINQGWGTRKVPFGGSSSSKIDYTIYAYPSNAQIVHYGMYSNPNENGRLQLRTSLLSAQDFGNTPAPKGRMILNLFNKDRISAVYDETGIVVSGIPNETIDNRPQAVAFFAGRVFTSVGSTVYYSQIVTKEENISKFHQEADPTAENINEIVDTDGGSIPIPDSGDIKALVSAKSGLIVFASNGIWFISGQDAAFTATNLQTSFVSSLGVQAATSVLQVEDTAYYHNDSGIYTFSFDSSTGAPSVVNITKSTIQTFFLNIAAKSRENMVSVYDPLDKKIYWLYNTDTDYDGLTYRSRYDGLLVLDLTLGAFYPLKVETLASNSPYIYGAFITPELKTIDNELIVVDSLGDTVTDSLGETVVIDQDLSSPTQTVLSFITARPSGVNHNYTFAQFSNTDLVDWEKEDSVGVGYEAFLLTGYMIEDDIMRFKQAPYIQAAFNRTETSFVNNGSGGVEFDRPSSCLLEARWDWSDNTVSGKIGSSQEIYRFRRPFISGGIGSSFDNGYPVVTTKTKVRGRGRSLHLKFTSPAEKDCQLLGWAILGLGNTNP